MNVFITGVSSGLGHGLAEAHLDQGDSVYGVSRRAPEDLLSRDRFQFLSLDLSDFNTVRASLPGFYSMAPDLDVIYLNAGILGELKDLSQTPVEDLRQMMDVNVYANKILLDELKRLRIPASQIITISSGASVNGNRGWSGYALSKAALNMLTQLYAREWEEAHFTALAPGLIDTAMQDYLCDVVDADRYPAVKKLKEARGTDAMPDPKNAGQRIIKILPKLKEHPSGAFVDIRNL